MAVTRICTLLTNVRRTVDAVMLTGATSKEESDRTYKRLQAMASEAPNTPEIKLCYVTVRVDIALVPVVH